MHKRLNALAKLFLEFLSVKLRLKTFSSSLSCISTTSSSAYWSLLPPETIYIYWPSPSSSISTTFSPPFVPLFSGFVVSTQPSPASFSKSSALSSWYYYNSLTLFSHGTPFVTKYCISGSRCFESRSLLLAVYQLY